MLKDLGTRVLHIAEVDEPGIYLINALFNECRRPISGRGLWLRVCSGPAVKAGLCALCYPLIWEKPRGSDGRGAFILKSRAEADQWRGKHVRSGDVRDEGRNDPQDHQGGRRGARRER